MTMTIEGIIEGAREVTSLEGMTYYAVTTKGRKFITEDREVGEKCIDNRGNYGTFRYRFWLVKGEQKANTYYLEEWTKL
jgi:hypothetical protein